MKEKGAPSAQETRRSDYKGMSSEAPTSMLNCIIDLDKRCSMYIYNKNMGTPMGMPRAVLKTLENSGDGRLWIPGTIALWLALALPPLSKPRWVVFNLFIGLLFDLTVIGFLKFLIRRPRPVYNHGMHLVVSMDHWSFPSGHASRAFFVASFLCLCFLENTLWVETLGVRVFILVATWSIVTSASRVLLGRHFVLDVVAGAGLGVVEGIVVYNLLSFPEEVSERLYLWFVGNACRQQWHQPYLPLPDFCKALNSSTGM
uniref:Phosphatidic acid phosphatase type 2/haloperoxidase domain-containing protein n=1 Tax=Araucaria cunninghamii TaxID=56994 RepID=A0A0D6R535_ARACU